MEYRTPGQLIQALLDERGWTQRVLAIVLSLDETTLNHIIRGNRKVTAELALALAEVFGVPAERFIDLQASYDLAKARLVTRPDPGRATRARLFGDLPVAEMIRRGWLNPAPEDIRDVQQVEKALKRFFGAESLDEIEVLPHATKRTETAAPVTAAQVAWICRVKQIASEMLVPPYSEVALHRAASSLRSLLSAPEETRRVPRVLAECGVRFVIVESLSAAKIDGVCFWLTNAAPVIGMSLRYDRIDNFWFVLRHEMEHVLRQHGRTAAMVDVELEGERAGVGDGVAEEERVANAAAADFCVPRHAFERFIARKSPFFHERDILGFSRTIGVHPGLVAGQLQHHIGRFDRFRVHLAKVRHAVAPSALVDGWGDVVPTA